MNLETIKFQNYDLCIYTLDDQLIAISRGLTHGYDPKSFNATKYAVVLKDYFEGKPIPDNAINLPQGTPFQQKVWSILLKIPYGETWSYKDVAIALGEPRKTRAVANAIGKNKLLIVIPCHRVIGSDGKLHGFAGGLDLKASLLHHEKGELA